MNKGNRSRGEPTSGRLEEKIITTTTHRNCLRWTKGKTTQQEALKSIAKCWPVSCAALSVHLCVLVVARSADLGRRRRRRRRPLIAPCKESQQRGKLVSATCRWQSQQTVRENKQTS